MIHIMKLIGLSTQNIKIDRVRPKLARMAIEPQSPGLRRGPAPSRVRSWWWRLAPHRQDRFAVLAPLAAVLLFLAAIVASFGYLRLEEIDREQEAVKRDVEYTQQRLRLRLLERQ